MANVLDRHLAEIFGQHEKIGRLSDFEAALEPFLKRREGPVDGVYANRRGQVDALVGATDTLGPSSGASAPARCRTMGCPVSAWADLLLLRI